MKQIYLSALFLFVINSVYAIVRTVSNSPTTLAQYNTIQAAVDVSSSGDTIYVHGSPNDYAGFTITDVRLVVIGPGWKPDKTFGFVARVNGMTITGASASNSEIQGLVFYNNVSAYTGTHPDGLKFYRNEFQSNVYMQAGGTTYKDYIFQGNYFNTGTLYANGGSTYQNFLIQNNIFWYSNSWNIYDFTLTNNVMIDHNLFYGPASGSTNIFAGTCNALTISNNIFVRRNAATNCNNSFFNNNITFNAGTNNPWAVNGNSDAGGNVVNQDPQMADQVSVNSGTNNPLLDFNITAGPANNSGSDAKDMGLMFDLTGSLNWANSRNSRLPRIFSMNLTTPTIPVGGTLNVNVEARKSN